MRFSLTGDQADAALLAWSIARSTDHSLGDVHIRGALENCLSRNFPADARRVHQPEEVLVASETDAVIVAESRSEESIRLVRHASQADYHVVVIPPNDLSTAYSYELHLLLDESNRGIVVLTGSWYLPDGLCADLTLTDSQLGLPTSADDRATAAVLMHAIDACSSLGFADSQVTVLGTNENSPGSSRRIVLSGSALDGLPSPAVTLNFSDTTATFHLQTHSGQESIDRQIIMPGHVDNLPNELAETLCRRVTARLLDAAACQTAMEQFSRTLQVVAAVDRSIRRRRTIDVYADELTERSVFKTQMTAIGCGVLTWLMLGMIGYLLLGQLLKPPSAVMKVMRALWIAPVVIFLVAQFLLPLARRRKQAAQTSSDNETTKDNDDNSATHSI